MRKLTIGILAHVDAGKTTLSESLLYYGGKIDKLGRVDKQDAYLDNNVLERERGITIFSKQAIFELGDIEITLLDTPGHIDFSTEMERTLNVLDYAILVVSGTSGVQSHTKTLWKLFETYKIPVFIFVNKMDQRDNNKKTIINKIKMQLNNSCIDFTTENKEQLNDELSICDENLIYDYLENGKIDIYNIKESIKHRRVFPVYFGSALKLEGIDKFILGLQIYTQKVDYISNFAAKIFKISRDEQGNRLTHMKITGGSLKVRDLIIKNNWQEKINQIRIYSGIKYEFIQEAHAGTVCAITGLSQTKSGQGLGVERDFNNQILEPVISYKLTLPDGYDERRILPNLYELEEEEPKLNIIWDDQSNEIIVKLMGEVQIEILQNIILDRFGVEVKFDDGSIIYKETINNTVEGVGHFEPLRHYAEVHLLLEPLNRGDGLIFETKCSEDILSKNWQKAIMTHLQEKSHIGVLTGSAITDIRITLVSGKAHNKHTEGGDFRQATYRAVRQGLKEAQSTLLEPYYEFQLEIPEKMVGRAMTDIEQMYGTCTIKYTDGKVTMLEGTAPVSTMRNYQKNINAYTKGFGKLYCEIKGYGPCHNTMEVISNIGYDSDNDVLNPTSSIFYSNGAGFAVKWDQVKDYMHLESYIQKKTELSSERIYNSKTETDEIFIDLDEIDQIFNRTFYSNQGKKSTWQKQKSMSETYYESKTPKISLAEKREEFLLVDAYNIIHTWPELNHLIEDNMDAARNKLLDILCNYKAIIDAKIIVVFDAYRVRGRKEEIIKYNNINVIYTKEAQTADQYIEKFAYDNKKKFNITVATSDGMQQIIISGAGANLLSARELREDVINKNKLLMEKQKETENKKLNYISEIITKDIKDNL
ncbi:MAG TPA: GTP-binding protein [Clostridiales bacterium]|nr:GTP-binding protein [Clostridiales bacterium]